MDKRRRHELSLREYRELAGKDPAMEEVVRLLRVRQMAYRTEESYLGWIRRLAAFRKGQRLDEMDESAIKAFLSHLAVEEQVSATTQRQALNACVFLLREVLGRELGDFSDYIKGRQSRHCPVVYSRYELRRVFLHEQDRSEGRRGVYLPPAL